MAIPVTFDAMGIAARIRGLIGGQDAGNIEATAHRLGVSELSMRMCIDPRSPVLTLDVLAAVVNNYGVDPSWLLYGEYDSGTHRRAVETGEHVTPTDLLRVAADRSDAASPHLRLEA